MIEKMLYILCLVWVRAVVCVVTVVIVFTSQVFAEGTFRERIRERIMERRQENTPQSSEKRQIDPEKSLQEISLKLGGQARTYLVHVPKSYRGSDSVPLVLVFHGGGGSGRIMAKDEFYGWISKSDEEDFIAVFPNGTGPFGGGNFASWNAGTCCAYARDHHIDDVGFVRELIRDIKGRFSIDEKRIFATGMSNGGMFSYTLACEMSDVFAAVASVAGTDGNSECHPQRPIAILHIHARNDTHVLFNGGAGPGAFKDPSKVTDFISVSDSIDRWLKRDGCEAVSRRVLDVSGAYCDLYDRCQAGSRVELCVTESGAHSWPGAQSTPLKKPEPPSQALDATDVIWDFFNSTVR